MAEQKQEPGRENGGGKEVPKRDTMPNFRKREKVPPIPRLSGEVAKLTGEMVPCVAEKAQPLIAYITEKAQPLVEGVRVLEKHLQGNSEKVEEIQKQVDTVETLLGKERNRVDTAIGRGVNNGKMLEELEKKVMNVRTEVEELKNTCRGLEGKVKRLYEILEESNVEKMGQQLDKLVDTVSGIQDRMRSTETSALDAEFNSSGVKAVIEKQKEEMQRIKRSIPPGPSAQALQPASNVVSKPPAPVELPAAIMPASQGKAGRSDGGKTKEAKTRDLPTNSLRRPVGKPALKLIGGAGTNKHPKATTEKAKEHAETLGEYKPKIKEIEETTKRVIEIFLKRIKKDNGGLGAEMAKNLEETYKALVVQLTESKPFVTHANYLERVKKDKSELGAEMAKNLEETCKVEARIKNAEQAVGSILHKQKLSSEKNVMDMAIQNARKPLKSIKLQTGDVNEAQAYTDALLESQKNVMGAIATAFHQLIQKRVRVNE